MAQDLNGTNVVPAKNIVKVNVLRANVKQTKVIDTDIVFVLEDGRTVFIRDGAVQSLLDNGFSVEFSDGDQATGQELLQSAGAAELSSVALTGPQGSAENAAIVVQAPQSAGTSPVAQPSSGGGLKTWLAVGTPLVGGVLGGVLGGGGSAAATTTTAGTGTNTAAAVKPATPVINVVSSDDKVSATEKAAGISVSGTSEASASVTVIWGNTTKTVTADSTGRWSATFATGEVPADAAGTTVSATVKSTAGVSSDPATKIVLIDATAPAAPVIAKVAGDDIVGPTEKTAGVNVNGTAEVGSIVSVEFGGVNKSVAADPGGNWGVNFSATEVPVAGNYAVTATTRDAIGNVATAPASRLVVVAAAITASGQIVAGPVVVGNGLTVDIFRGDGTLLVSGIRVNADGSFTANNLPVGAGDVVFARVADNTTAADYLDEATGVAVDLNAVLLAVKAVEGTSVTMNINPLTTIAAIKAGLAADGSGTVANAAAATNANTATAQAFGLSGIDITTTSVVATNSGGYTSVDGLSSGEKVGAVLAALSGLDSLNAGNSQTTINSLSQLVTVDGNKGQLSGEGQVSLMRGATVSDDKVEGSLQNLISDSVATSSPVTQVTINAIATDNIITANEVASLTLSGTVGPDVTGVSVLLGTRTAAAVVSGGTWSYTPSAADISALGADGAKVIQAQAALRNAPSVSASRLVTLKIAPPASPSLNVVSGDNAINSAEKTAGVAFGGTGEAGSTVFLTFGSFTKNVLVDASGTWTTAFLASEIPADGSATVSVLAKDQFGNSSGTVTRSIQIDTVVPSLPTIRSVTGDDLIGPTEKVGGVQIQGTADPLGSIRLTFGNLVRTATVDALGNWSVNLISSQVPEDGEYALTVVQSDAVGNSSAVATRTVKVDAQPPGKPVIQPVATDNIINAAEKLNGVTLRGTSEPNASIELTWGSISRIIKVAANGTWSASFNGAQIPADGTANISAVATDSSGNVSEPGIRTVTIDTLSQDLTIASVATDNVINAAEKAVNVTVTGQAEPGANVVVNLGGITRNALANQIGVWVVNFPTAEIPADTAVTTVTAQSTDQAGNISGLVGRDIRIDSAIPSAPVINIVSGDDSINADESTSSVEVSGTAEAGALVTVSWGTATRTSTADADGVWRTTFAASQIPPEGASIISATARDSALNVSAATERPVLIDIATARPVINTIAGNDVINATERTNGVLVSGTAEAGATVRLVSGTVIKNPVALADGTWSQLFIAAEVPLSGNSSITATPTDGFGNVGTAQTRNFSIDTSVSPATFDNVAGADNRVNASEKSLGVQVTGTAEAGSAVVVTWGATVKSVTTDASNVWATSFTSGEIPSDGETTITALVTDLAGNVSVQSGQPVKIDTVAPDAPIMTLPIAGDNVIISSERAAGVVVAGTSEPNAAVTIAWGTTSSKTVKADAAGNWSATFVGAEINDVGAATISVTQRDVAGNTGPAATAPVVVNTGAPTAPIIDAVAGNNVVNAAEKVAGVTISGTALSGSTISVTWGSTKTVTAGQDGRWSILFAAGDVPVDGSPTVSAFQTDTLGNVSPTTTRAITVDTAPPAIPVITTPIAGNDIINAAEKAGTVTISGTAPSATTVEVRIGGGTPKSETSSGGGLWSITFASGEIPADATGVLIEARTIDTAGNPSAWVGKSVDIDATLPATPVISNVAGDNLINATERAGNIAVNGTAEAGVSVRVTWNSIVKNVTANGSGVWSATYSSLEQPSDGTSMITARATDVAGNTNVVDGERSVTTLTSAAAQPVINVVTGDDRINIAERNAGITVTGTASGGASVRVTFGTTTKTVTATGTGDWTATFATSEIAAEGSPRAITAVQTDVNGNVSAPATRNVDVDLTAPISLVVNQTGGTDVTINAAEKALGVAVSGTATDAANIEVIWGSVTKTVAVTSNAWTAVFGSTEIPADATTSQIRVTAIDAAGNRSVEQTSNVTIDAAAPATPVISTVAGDDLINAAESAGSIIVNGTAEANARLVVTWNSIVKNVTANGLGAWSATYSSAEQPSDGPSTLTARATDVAGNVNAVDGERSVTTLTSGAPRPVIGQVATDNRINITERNAGITVNGTASNGASVAVTFGSTTKTVIATGTGFWTADFTTAQIAAEGLSRPITAVQTDVNGNVSATATRNVDVDLTAPNVAMNQTGGTDLTINAAEKGASVVVSGTTDAGNTVFVNWGGIQKSVTSATGSWSFSFATGEVPADTALSTIRVTAQDEAGNISSEVTQNVKIDTDPPKAVTAVTFAGDNVVNLAESALPSLNFTGNLPANHGAKKIIVVWNGRTETLDIADETTAVPNWTLPWFQAYLPSSASSTALVFTDDAAGNRTQVDRIITNSRTPAEQLNNVVVALDGKINLAESKADSIIITGGNAAAGSTVFVTLGGVTGQTNTIAGDGTWTVTIATSSLSFSGSSLALSAFQRNSAGNESTAVTQTIGVDIAPPAVLVLNDVTALDSINAAEAGQTITLTGSVEPGVTLVAVTFGTATPKNAVVTQTTGNWTVSFSTAERSALVDGTPVRISVTATDDFGNTTNIFRDIQVDTSPPTGLTIGAVSGDNIVTAAEAGQGVVISGQAAAGASISVNWGGRMRTATATGTGAWTVTYGADRVTGVPEDGAAVALSVTQSDSFGNSQTVSRSIQIDTTAPIAPSLMGISNDYGTTLDQITSQNGNILVGRGVAGEFVDIKVNGSTVANRVTVNSRGIWTYTASELSGSAMAGTVTLKGIAVDGVGNSGAETSFTSVQRQVQAPGPIEMGVVAGTATPGLIPLAETNNVAVQTGGQLASASGRISGVYLYGAQGYGAQSSDRFGGAFAVGDVNSDNIPDLIIGARLGTDINLTTGALGFAQVGEVNVIYGKSNWSGITGIETQKMGTGGYGLRGEAKADEFFGANVAFLGDVNGDGRGDFAATAYSGDSSSVATDNTGSVYVMFSPASTPGVRQTNAAAGTTGADKFVSSVSTMDKGSGFIFRGTTASENVGSGLVGAKLNKNDNITDIVIGLPNYDRPAASSGALVQTALTNGGAVAIIFGRSDGNYAAGTVKQELNVNSLVAPGSLVGSDAGAEGFLIRGTSGNATADNQFGSANGKGDFNKDGIEDLIIGAPQYEPSSLVSNTGAAYVIYGKADKAAWNAILTDDPSRPNVGGPGVFGKVLDVANLQQADGFRITGETSQNDASLGGSVMSAGDVNGDGIEDMIIGAPTWDLTGTVTNSGAAYVVFGKTGTRANLDLATLTSADGFIIRGAALGDTAGNSAAGVGDVNGDGYGDIVVTVPSFDRTGALVNVGQAYLILGKADGSIYGSLSGGRSILNLSDFGPSDGIIMVGPSTSNMIFGGSNVFRGTSVVAAGDLNQDGFADFMLAAPQKQPAESYIIFGSAGLGGMTQTGTGVADNLLGGTFNDTMSGGGGADNILTFQGNDIITVPDLGFNFIDGGAGMDTLRFAGSGGSLDLSTLAAGAIKDIERIDLVAGSSANTLTINQQTLLDLSSTSDRLTVLGDSGDKVIASGFSAGAQDQNVNGILYDIYTNGLAELWVQDGVVVELPPAQMWSQQVVIAA